MFLVGISVLSPGTPALYPDFHFGSQRVPINDEAQDVNIHKLGGEQRFRSTIA
jgi:hypothetical protein